MYRHADSLVADKKNEAAKPFLVDAEELLKKSLVDLGARKGRAAEPGDHPTCLSSGGASAWQIATARASEA